MSLKHVLLVVMAFLQCSYVISSDESKKSELIWNLIQKGDYDAIISNMKNIDAVSSLGNPLLHMLVQKNQYKFVEKLVQAGANTLIKDWRGCTAYDYAETCQMKKLLKNNMDLRKAVDFYNDAFEDEN